MSLPDDYQVEKVTSALAEIKIYIAWDFDGVDELYVWLQNSVDGTVYYQELGDFTVTEDSDGGGVFILVENNQGVSVDVSVARTTPKTQTYSLNNGEALNPEALIKSLDKTVKMIQDESKGYDNQNITSVNPFVYPDKVSRADKISIFDSNGDPDFDTPDNILAPQIGYAQEWATKAEDMLVSSAAGGNGTTDYSSLHHAAKAEASADTAGISASNALSSDINAAASAAAAQVSADEAEDALSDLVGVYKTIYIPAKEMTAQITAGATSGISETTTNKVMDEYFEFPDGADTFVQFNRALPDKWDLGQIKYKAYWTTAAVIGAGDAIWSFDSSSVADGVLIDQIFNPSMLLTDPYNSTAGSLHISPPTAFQTIDNTPSLQDRIQFQIGRFGIFDSYTEPLRLLGVAIQYKETDTPVVAW